MDTAMDVATDITSRASVLVDRFWELVTPERFWNFVSLRGVAKLAGLWAAYRVGVALYNISPFHPLYRFPGPRLASATYLYEAYYDWILVGRYGKEIKRMHDKYGA